MEIQEGVNSPIGMDSQQQPPQESQKGTTFLLTCLNGLNALTGVGILSIPYALSQGGWLSLIFLFLVAAICYYTGLLIQRCMDFDPRIKTYPDIGQVAFGRKGRLTISVFIYLELYLVAVEFLILEGDNLHKLFPNVHFHLVIFTAAIILPTTWLRSLGLLAYVSFGGVLASFVLLCSVFWIGAVDGVGFHNKGSLWRWNGFPTAMSLYTFCYMGHPLFPTLCSSMKSRRQFPKVLLVCFVFSTITYGSMAVLGYLMFGENLNSQVTLNLPAIKISSKIAIYTTLINPGTKYALIIAPITTAIEDISPFPRTKIFSILIRTTVVISTVIIALTIPLFGYVMAFIGAFLGISVSIVFPCICYLKIKKAYAKLGMELVLICLILGVGILVSAVGTYISVANIVKHV